MLSLRLRLPARRCYSQALAAAPPEQAKVVQHPYFVRRNSQGSVPVYTDVRMHNKYCTLIRNVEGNVEVRSSTVCVPAVPLTCCLAHQQLAAELKQSLFQPGTLEAERVKFNIVRGRHIVLTGGHFKKELLEWLTSKGF